MYSAREARRRRELGSIVDPLSEGGLIQVELPDFQIITTTCINTKVGLEADKVERGDDALGNPH